MKHNQYWETYFASIQLKDTKYVFENTNTYHFYVSSHKIGNIRLLNECLELRRYQLNYAIST